MRVKFNHKVSLQGKLTVPPSKSYTHRAYIAGLLNKGGIIGNPLHSDDTDATLDCIRNFSGNVETKDREVLIERESRLIIQEETFSASESGTLLRFLLPVLTLLPGPDKVLVNGKGSLRERSNKKIIQSLKKSGFQIKATGSDQRVPITCYPGQRIQDDQEIFVATQSTSQLLSGWLLALSSRNGKSLVRRTQKIVSKPYVTMTEQVLEKAGVKIDHPSETQYQVDSQNQRALDFRVPGDFSSAAFFIVGGVLTDGELKFEGLLPEDPQADRRIVKILHEIGADLYWDDTSLVTEGRFLPDGFTLDASNCPDLVPILSVLGCFSKEEVIIKNISHLRNKESNRIDETCEELSKAGIDIIGSEDQITIHPSNKSYKRKFVLKSHNDHRLAMAFSIFCQVLGNGTVDGAECVSKSYPQFFEDLRFLGGEFQIQER